MVTICNYTNVLGLVGRMSSSKRHGPDVHPGNRQLGSDQPTPQRLHLDHFGRPEGFTSSQSLLSDLTVPQRHRQQVRAGNTAHVRPQHKLRRRLIIGGSIVIVVALLFYLL